MPDVRALLPIALTLCSASSLAQPTLCTKGEVTAWSCVAKGKVYSVCASPDLSATSGYMQYRAGKNAKVEFAFPKPQQHPRSYFQLRLAPRGASLGFENEGYAYSVYEPLAGPTEITIFNGETLVGSITCDSATDTLTLTETQNRFKSLGIYP